MIINAELRSLFCQTLGLWLDTADESPYSFPSLVNLSLTSVAIFGETDRHPLFSPFVLPALQTLSLKKTPLRYPDSRQRLESIAGTLEHLTCGDLGNQDNLRRFLKRCGRLVAFNYFEETNLLPAPLDFGTPLRFFRLDYSSAEVEPASRAIRDIGAAERSGFINHKTVVFLSWASAEQTTTSQTRFVTVDIT